MQTGVEKMPRIALPNSQFIIKHFTLNKSHLFWSFNMTKYVYFMLKLVFNYN